MEEMLSELSDAQVFALLCGIEVIDEGDYGWYKDFRKTIRECRELLTVECENRNLSWKTYQRP